MRRARARHRVYPRRSLRMLDARVACTRTRPTVKTASDAACGPEPHIAEHSAAIRGCLDTARQSCAVTYPHYNCCAPPARHIHPVVQSPPGDAPVGAWVRVWRSTRTRRPPRRHLRERTASPAAHPRAVNVHVCLNFFRCARSTRERTHQPKRLRYAPLNTTTCLSETYKARLTIFLPHGSTPHSWAATAHNLAHSAASSATGSVGTAAIELLPSFPFCAHHPPPTTSRFHSAACCSASQSRRARQNSGARSQRRASTGILRQRCARRLCACTGSLRRRFRWSGARSQRRASTESTATHQQIAERPVEERAHEADGLVEQPASPEQRRCERGPREQPSCVVPTCMSSAPPPRASAVSDPSRGFRGGIVSSPALHATGVRV